MEIKMSEFEKYIKKAKSNKSIDEEFGQAPEMDKSVSEAETTFMIELIGNVLTGKINNREIKIDIQNPEKEDLADLAMILKKMQVPGNRKALAKQFGGNDEKADLNSVRNQLIPDGESV